MSKYFKKFCFPIVAALFLLGVGVQQVSAGYLTTVTYQTVDEYYMYGGSKHIATYYTELSVRNGYCLTGVVKTGYPDNVNTVVVNTYKYSVW